MCIRDSSLGALITIEIAGNTPNILKSGIAISSVYKRTKDALRKVQKRAKEIKENPMEVKKLIGYLPEGAPQYGEMIVKDFLSFIAKIRGIEKNKMNAAITSVIDNLSLHDVVNKRLEHLSKGFKRRVGIAQAIIHDPEILIMDEPTDGLDPNQKYDVRELIKKISKNKTIVISTHILEEVEAVCTRAAIISKGKLLFNDTPKKLKESGDGNLDDIFRTITMGSSS
mgnify:CR=1 FL=1